MIRGAIYARVSSDRQEHEETIQSQLAELRARVQLDEVVDCLEMTDESYARDNLVRPGLDRLRDLVAQGDFDRLYIQCPDRLTSGAKLVLLVEEFQKHGVEVIFLKGSVDETPEGKLLLHMQGAIAEYEHTKIAERTRRGKLYWARQGAMVGGHAPYGYRLVRRTDTTRAKLEIDEYPASVVRQMYRWLVEEAMSTRGIAKRLTESDIPTSKGAAQWQPTAVSRILRNRVYRGEFVYCQSERVLPASRMAADPYRQNRKTGRKARPESEWITIPVPAIVEASVWNAAQDQLQKNYQNSPRNNQRHQYLLRGLIRCPRCGSTYTGAVQHGRRRYRCTRADGAISSTGKKCPPGAISADLVEEVVWEAVNEALRRPDVLIEEYRRRLKDAQTPASLEAERKQVSLALRRAKSQQDRITDAYINEAMELERYKTEMDQLRARERDLANNMQDLDQRNRQESDNTAALSHLEQFCRRMSQGLAHLTFAERQQLLRLVVERITVQEDLVRVETIIPMGDNGVKLRAPRPELVEGCIKDNHANYSTASKVTLGGR